MVGFIVKRSLTVAGDESRCQVCSNIRIIHYVVSPLAVRQMPIRLWMIIFTPIVTRVWLQFSANFSSQTHNSCNSDAFKKTWGQLETVDSQHLSFNICHMFRYNVRPSRVNKRSVISWHTLDWLIWTHCVRIFGRTIFKHKNSTWHGLR